MVRMNLEFDQDSYNKIVAIQEKYHLRRREDAIILLLKEYEEKEVKT
ncbi:MAG: hypothetical protein HXS54_06280 [Theionarchaea archaeon]|nr:hypothetical protein [Theionarchaea archaeon]DBA34866.1 TPA_asm: hypothetical protein vir521_00072 [Caudoviricetes sp. vir521]